MDRAKPTRQNLDQEGRGQWQRDKRGRSESKREEGGECEKEFESKGEREGEAEQGVSQQQQRRAGDVKSFSANTAAGGHIRTLETFSVISRVHSGGNK